MHEDITHEAVCGACGAPLVAEAGVGLVDARSGDQGGTYDVCGGGPHLSS